MRLASLGYPGVATYGASVSREQFNIIRGIGKVIFAMDNDEAGKESSKRLAAKMSPPRSGILWWNYKNTSAKDIGDMTDEEIREGCMTASVVPPWIF